MKSELELLCWLTQSWHPIMNVVRVESMFTKAWAVPDGLTATATSSAVRVTWAKPFPSAVFSNLNIVRAPQIKNVSLHVWCRWFPLKPPGLISPTWIEAQIRAPPGIREFSAIETGSSIQPRLSLVIGDGNPEENRMILASWSSSLSNENLLILILVLDGFNGNCEFRCWILRKTQVRIRKIDSKKGKACGFFKKNFNLESLAAKVCDWRGMLISVLKIGISVLLGYEILLGFAIIWWIDIVCRLDLPHLCVSPSPALYDAS